MSDLVPMDPEHLFILADRIAKSPLMPDAYRGKPTEAAVAMMYGQEVGLPPMTSLQRIIVINGKPTLDAGAMTALIRREGHSLTGDATSESATATGVRRDTGDTMSVTFTMEDAKRAGLVRQNSPWTKFPKSMLWSRAVSQLARELFGDVLLGISYVPEEMEAVEEDRPGKHSKPSTPPDMTISGLTEGMEGETPVPAVIEATGEIVEVIDPPVEPAPEPEPLPPVTDEMEIAQLKEQIKQITADLPVSEQPRLRTALLGRFGPAQNLTTLETAQAAFTFAAGWPESGKRRATPVPEAPDESF